MSVKGVKPAKVKGESREAKKGDAESVKGKAESVKGER
jgi:hypothetical protein